MKWNKKFEYIHNKCVTVICKFCCVAHLIAYLKVTSI